MRFRFVRNEEFPNANIGVEIESAGKSGGDGGYHNIKISNPPFSRRDDVLKHLYELDIPFAIVIGFNGLFDNRKRFELFKANGIQMLVPRGRMRFVHKEYGLMKSPVFQSIYICSKLLDRQIVFSDSVF